MVLGSGTYGVVLKARCRKTGEVVAIKRFKLSEKAPQVKSAAQPHRLSRGYRGYKGSHCWSQPCV